MSTLQNRYDFVLFFAGSYKATSGVDDLIVAFKNLHNKYKNLKTFNLYNLRI